MADERVGLSREEALTRLRARLVAYASKRLELQDAEDLAQDTLMVLTTKYAHVAAPEELTAVSIGIVKRKMLAFWRKAKRRREKGDVPAPEREDGSPLDAPSDAPGPEELAHLRERRAMVVEAVAQLGGKCREILRRKLEGASVVEIAAAFGRPVNTVYSWDHRCHERLKSVLAERWASVTAEVP
jgi:RNA polymerase sigma-70 factor (ECF subfamily)